MSTPKKIFVVDVMAMAFRNFHAFSMRPLSTSRGEPTSAIFGSVNFVLRLIEKENPDYLIFASDTSSPTFRHKMYDLYKANRDAMPEDLAAQIEPLYKFLDLVSAPVLKQPGFEADDIIGSIARQFSDQDHHIYIVSGDKDFMQLINDRVFLYAPKKAQKALLCKEPEVFDKFGCTPDEVVHALALIGDSADNVPGVKGIGEKGAAKLIAEYSTLDNIYKNIEKMPENRAKKALGLYRESAYLSLELVKIKIDMDLGRALDDFKFDPQTYLDDKKVLEFCEHYELTSIVKKISDKISPKDLVLTSQVASKAKNKIEKEDVPAASRDLGNYKLVNEKASVHQLIEDLKQTKEFVFDTETTGLNIHSDKPIGVSFAFDNKEDTQAFYVPLLDDHLEGISKEDVIYRLKEVFASSAIKIAHNLKFDMHQLKNIEIEITGPIRDTMIMAYLSSTKERSYSLDRWVLKEFSHEMIPLSDLLGPKKKGSMLDVPLDKLSEYASEDADFTFRLYKKLLGELTQPSHEQVWKLATEVEFPLIPVIARMERLGIYIDEKYLSKLSQDFGVNVERLKKEIIGHAGEEFNVNSPKQLQVILYEKLKIHEELGIRRIKKTKTGYSTDVSVLEKLSAHPLPKALLEYRTISKLKSTYVDALPQLIDSTTDRIHTSFAQTGTATGRLSSHDPNLQNIPIRSEDGRKIRQAFTVKDDDHILMSADYSQMELRLLAHLANEENLSQDFANDLDIHLTTAMRIFNVDAKEAEGELRSRAKAINFGLIYGMGAGRLARQTGVKMAEAKQFIESYFENYSAIKQYMDKCLDFARENEYTETLLGRQRHLPEINGSNRMAIVSAENQAINSPVQGSAADVIKVAMIKIDQEITKRKLKSKMLLQIHDELVFEVHKEELEEMKELVRHEMEHAVELNVPLKVQIGTGSNWLQAH